LTLNGLHGAIFRRIELFKCIILSFFLLLDI
jgi:hypothetical protein